MHRNLLTHHRPALYGDLLELTVQVVLVQGARGIRHTTIRRAASGELLAEVVTEWVWTNRRTGRPGRVPAELVAKAAAVTRTTLARQPHLVRDLRLVPD